MIHQLSAEELILSFVLIDEYDAAKLLKDEIYEEETEEVFNIRLDSAMNGLLAKDLLIVIDDETAELKEDYVKVLELMLRADKVVRFSLIENEKEAVRAIYFKDNKSLLHDSVQGGIAHRIRYVKDWKEWYKTFVDEKDPESASFRFVLPEREFENLLELCREEEMPHIHQLFQTNVKDKNIAAQLAKDFAATKGMLGSIFITDYDSSHTVDKVVSYLVLQGSEQNWLIDYDEKKQEMTIKPLQIERVFNF
ncbi:hypothetical protein DCC39_17295 [Pueribacillus theae]|uniref:Uncharacterized protein n=1 Tax=Pueribacillus theae TaxID=2171751 RepID=A0A2U1JPD1_9BACI|nr:hypothetical protein [Pueribacillus theae]PWA06688.1 hypothetical protein DCC39_17295 [Pueribacillus theae]